MSRILVIPDLHIPFHHKRAFDFLQEVYKEYACDTVVCVGDIVDQHNFSRWFSDPNGDSPSREINKVRKYVKKLADIFPKLYICYGNHDLRLYKKAKQNGFPSSVLRSLPEIYQTPKGWIWDNVFTIDNIRFEHGDSFSNSASGEAAIKQLPIKNSQSTVFGHFHISAGINYIATPKMLIFGFNVGCLIDKNAYAFEYGKLWKSKPILGCGVILNKIPYYIPMRLK